MDGTLRYAEVRQRSEPYFIPMDLFAADGHEQHTIPRGLGTSGVRAEGVPSRGALGSEGRAMHDPIRMKARLLWEWLDNDLAAAIVEREVHQDGKLAVVR